MERSKVPTWAKPKCTEPQERFIRNLMEERKMKKADHARLAKKLNNGEIDVAQASKTIEWLLAQPHVEKAQQGGAPDPRWQLHPGRYAVENSEGELRFYHLWQSRDKKVRRLYVLHGPDASTMNSYAQYAIVRKILSVGQLECAIRYGREIGACSNCGRRLTNRISRYLGIGPICGERLHDNFRESVKFAREQIVAEGYDPDEELEDE
jgi:hypothetical protein